MIGIILSLECASEPPLQIRAIANQGKRGIVGGKFEGGRGRSVSLVSGETGEAYRSRLLLRSSSWGKELFNAVNLSDAQPILFNTCHSFTVS